MKSDREEALTLLKDLVGIPSFVDKNHYSQKQIETYLINWFKKNLPGYELIKIPFDKERNNLLFYRGKGTYLFACHLDTVPPFNSKDLMIKIDDDKIYGLGTKDMKGGIVSTLIAIKKAAGANSSVLFYGDEEYGQMGMRVLSQSYRKIPKPKFMISPESRFNLGIGARGMCVIKIRIKGLRGHSSRPHLSIDAIKTFYKVVQDLERSLSKQTELGRTSVTITEIKGGLLVDEEITSHHGTIPDLAEGVLSLRVSIIGLTSKQIIHKIEKLVSQNKAKLESCEVLADYPARLCNLNDIKPLIQSIKNSGFKPEIGDPGLAGYNDVAILSEQIGVPLVNFGPYGENNHNPNEWVSLKSILDTALVYSKLLDNT